VQPAPPVPAPTPPPARPPWTPWGEARRDLRWALAVVVVLAVAGVLLGLLWWELAPRADFRVTGSGPQVIGDPSDELFAGDDSVYTLVVAGAGLLAGAIAWLFRRRRGLAGLLAVALGTLAADAVAWQVGELLGRGPSKAELADVGARVTSALHLAALPALAAGPFAAVLVYLAAALWTRTDDLGRPPSAEAEPVS
jgi:LPXTG-motif cell wall-anchored protein